MFSRIYIILNLAKQGILKAQRSGWVVSIIRKMSNKISPFVKSSLNASDVY